MLEDLEKEEKKVNEANEMLKQERSMFLSGPVVVFKWKNEEGWPVEYVSPNVKEILGYPDNVWYSNKIIYESIIFREDLKRVSEEVETNSKKGAKNFSHQPYRIVRKDGNTIWVNDYTTIIRDSKGDITHYLGYIIDISEQKKIERSLKESEEKYKALFDEASEAIFVADTKTRKLIDCNKAAEDLIGYTRKEILSMRADQLHPEDRIKETMEGFKKQAEGKIRAVESEVITKNRKRIPVNISTSLVKFGDKDYMFGIFSLVDKKNKGFP